MAPRVVLAALLAQAAVHSPAAVLPERSDEYQWRLCPPARLIPVRPGYTDPTTPLDHIEIRADSVRLVKEGVSQFSGAVEVVKGEQAIHAEVLSYDAEHETFNAEGRTHIWDAGMIWAGSEATYDLTSKVSVLEGGEYWILGGRGRGHARRLSNDRERALTVLEGVDYSTCPETEEAWRVSASKITLDHESDRGSARNAVLRVRNVPVFYFPYVNFPISDKRKSGFLSPSFGTTNESGFDARLPYYWNIAPNHDATLTPRVLTDRGVMMGGQYRYLNYSYEGTLDVEVLPGDRRHEDEDRSLVSFNHNHRMFQNRGNLRILFNNVSDDEYFEDFGSNIGATSQRFLDRRADFYYVHPLFRVDGLVQSYQTIDDTLPAGAGPYRRLPQVRFWGYLPTRSGFQPQLRAETTYFDHDARVTGGRVDIEPTLYYYFIRPYLDIRPSLALRRTEYYLDDPLSRFDDRESRTVPIFDLDASLFVERQVSLFGRSHIQTIEPRAYYLLIPKVGQDDIPVFDAGLFNISFPNLFRDNRFAGPDRIGDANQVTTAVTSRMLDIETGREAYRVSLGQIHYFRDREVTLPGRIVDDDSTSELIAEAAVNVLYDWSARGMLQWDPDEPQTELSAFSLRYHPNIDTVVNFGYRFRRAVSDIEQTDFSLRWPLTERLAVVGRWNYSLQESRALETVAGIEYESCCWGVRLLGRRFLRNSEGEFDTGMFMQVHFRGLGGFGKKSGSLLHRGIPGYDDPFE
jgi:LPS-assembly protein